MVDLAGIALESWDRQVRIIDNIVSLITPELMDAKSRDGEWTIGEQLCHIHGVRRGWLNEVAPESLAESRSLYTLVGEEYIPNQDLDLIREQLPLSAATIREVVEKGLQDPKPVGPYSHPFFFLQHMVWHEGWHAGSIIHALRANGHEPTDEWD